MKALAFTIFHLLIWSCTFAQEPQKIINSLKYELAIAKHDTSRVLIISELCDKYRTSKPDSALYFGEQGMALAEKIKYPKGLIRNTAYYGRVFRDLGNLPKSMAMQFKALQIAKDNDLLEETGLPLNYIGGNYGDLTEYSKALMYYKQATKIHETYTSILSTRLPNTLNNIGNAFLYLNQIDSANYYVQKAFDLFIQSKTVLNPLVFLNLANIQVKLGKNKLAIDYFHKGLELSQKTNNLQVYARITNDLAKNFQKTNQLDSCIYYAKKGLTEAQLISYTKGILGNSSLLAEIYDSKDPKEALRYLKIANAAKESLFGAGSIQAIQSLIAQEEVRQKEIEDAKLAYDNQLRQYAMLAGLALLLLVAFFLYRNNQKEKKAKILFQEKNEEIQSTLSQLKSTQAQLIQSEKLASLGELTAGIAHEIQNPLNFVNNFSEVSVEIANELKEEAQKPEIDKGLIFDLATDLAQNQEKINHHGKRASSIVKGMLEHSLTSNGVKEPIDINALADEYLRLAYHGLRAKDKTDPAHRFNSDFELIADENLPKIEVIPQDMGRVLLNLINNAFWAVNERNKKRETGYEPKVTVSTQLTANSQLLIAIKDNGTGMTNEVKAKIFQPFFTTKPTGQGTGLGLSLAYDIVTKGHGGTLEVESVEGEGTTFEIVLAL